MDGSTGHTEHRPEDGPLHQDQNSHTPRTCPEKEERHRDFPNFPKQGLENPLTHYHLKQNK